LPLEIQVLFVDIVNHYSAYADLSDPAISSRPLGAGDIVTLLPDDVSPRLVLLASWLNEDMPVLSAIAGLRGNHPVFNLQPRSYSLDPPLIWDSELEFNDRDSFRICMSNW
jgi:hypothetical protein